jgi:hypothetical protein
MNEAVNRLAREMADAIAAAVSSDARIEACHARARAEGFELQVSVEALIGFSSSTGERSSRARSWSVRRAREMTAHDRRFLRSLRIAADEASEDVE